MQVLFKGDNLVNLLCMMITWFASSSLYYMISYQLKYIKGNIYINGIISSISEIIAYTLSGVIIKIFNVKLTLLLSLLIAFSGMLSLIIVDTDNQITLGFFILGSKYGISQAFNTVYIANVKLFPV